MKTRSGEALTAAIKNATLYVANIAAKTHATFSLNSWNVFLDYRDALLDVYEKIEKKEVYAALFAIEDYSIKHGGVFTDFPEKLHAILRALNKWNQEDYFEILSPDDPQIYFELMIKHVDLEGKKNSQKVSYQLRQGSLTRVVNLINNHTSYNPLDLVEKLREELVLFDDGWLTARYKGLLSAFINAIVVYNRISITQDQQTLFKEETDFVLPQFPDLPDLIKGMYAWLAKQSFTESNPDEDLQEKLLKDIEVLKNITNAPNWQEAAQERQDGLQMLQRNYNALEQMEKDKPADKKIYSTFTWLLIRCQRLLEPVISDRMQRVAEKMEKFYEKKNLADNLEREPIMQVPAPQPLLQYQLATQQEAGPSGAAYEPKKDKGKEKIREEKRPLLKRG